MNSDKILSLASKFEEIIRHSSEEDMQDAKKKKKKTKKWDLPPGWTGKSRKEYHESLVGDTKHPVSKCIEKMKGNVDDPGAFCANLQDTVKGKGWRKKKKKKKSS